MRSLPTSISQELHRLSTDGSLICLFSITNSAGTVLFRKARNYDDVVWPSTGGYTWEKFWFELDTLEENTTGNIPELNIVTSNIGGFVEQELIDNDNFEDCTCTIYIVNSKCLDETDPVFSMEFTVKKPSVTRDTVTLSISAENPLLLIYPSWHVHGSICQYRRFGIASSVKGYLCGYPGGYPNQTCDRTLHSCVNFGNNHRFGAQLSLRDETWDIDES